MTIRFQLRPGTSDEDIRRVNSAILATKPSKKYCFLSDEYMEDWLKEINTDPDCPTGHLKPQGRDLTRAELSNLFPSIKVGELNASVTFSRMTARDAAKLAKVMAAEPLLLDIRGDWDRFSSLARESKGTPEVREQTEVSLSSLKKMLFTPPPPEKNMDRREKIESGIAVFRDFNGNSDICVLFGAVDTPRYMKDDQYIDDDYNHLYRDSANRPYMLLPLLKLGPKAGDSLHEIYLHARDIGLNVEPLAFFAATYGVTPNNAIDIFKSADKISERDALFAINKLSALINHRCDLAPDKSGAYLKVAPTSHRKDESGKREAIAAFLNVLIKSHGYSTEDAIAMSSHRGIGNKKSRCLERIDQLLMKDKTEQVMRMA